MPYLSKAHLLKKSSVIYDRCLGWCYLTRTYLEDHQNVVVGFVKFVQYVYIEIFLFTEALYTDKNNDQALVAQSLFPLFLMLSPPSPDSRHDMKLPVSPVTTFLHF